MQIRPIQKQDVAQVSRLMCALSEEFIVHESDAESAAAFLRENSEEGLRGFIDSGIQYHVAESDGLIVGFIAIREKRHLFYMFVDKRFHRQGVARRLWDVARQAAIEAGNEGVFTVNSSNHALPVYERFGFVRTAPMQIKNGLRFNPMQLVSAAALVGAP